MQCTDLDHDLIKFSVHVRNNWVTVAVLVLLGGNEA